MKVSVLGGASFCTPALFASMQGQFGGCEFILAARSAQSLASATRASRLVAGKNPPRITPVVCAADTCGQAIAGSAVVLLQMRVGNMPGRAFDEQFPLDFNLCGDEGLGPGGLSAAWRTWPELEPWLEAVRQHAPEALVLMMTSPVGILTRATHQRFPELRCAGICEVPYIALRDICIQLDVDIQTARFDYLGVNHIGWLYGLRSGHRDLVAEWAEMRTASGFPPQDIVKDWNAIPTKYLRLHFDPASAVTAQRAVPVPRAVQLESIQRSALALYTVGSEAQIRDLLRQRETPWYADSIVPLLQGLHEGEAAGPFFLSEPNESWTSALAKDDVLEIGCRVERGVAVRIPQSMTPSERITEFIKAFCLHERVATQAVLERDTRTMASALSLHPWVSVAAAQHKSLPANLVRTIVNGNRSVRI